MDRCLDKYIQGSGQKINRGKSSIHFSKNLNGSAVLPICNMLVLSIMLLKKMSSKAKHLSLSLLIPRSKYHALAELKE